MDKIKAALIHLAFSFVFVGSFLLFAYYIWYGRIFIDISGALVPAKILVGIDVILGPLLTLLIYKKGKKHLKLDITLIVLVQMAAFMYGAYSLYLGKPSLVVLKGGFFEIITEKNISPDVPLKIKNNLTLISQPYFVAVEPNKLITQQTAEKQQAFLQPINFTESWVQARSVSIDQAVRYLNISADELNSQLRILGTEDYEIYLMYDFFLNALLVVKGGQVAKIIHTPKE